MRTLENLKMKASELNLKDSLTCLLITLLITTIILLPHVQATCYGYVNKYLKYY